MFHYHCIVEMEHVPMDADSSIMIVWPPSSNIDYICLVLHLRSCVLETGKEGVCRSTNR